LGYYTGVWSHDGLSLATHGYTGALHIWERDPKALAPRPASTGHYGAVVDITWSPDGQFLLTASTDQTVRVIGQLESRNGESGESEWTELGRPQVHGHDLSCIAAMYPRPDHSSPLNMINEDKSVGRSNRNLCGYKYASGGEEKVIRVFQSPTAFLETLDMARGLVVGVKDRSRNEAYSTFTAYGATLPALGLSNKAFRFDEHAGENGQRHPRDGVPGIGADQYDVGPDFAPTCAPSSVGGRPLEEHLSQNTLWPEIHKLYGHGNELFCLAADPKGKYLASACKSQSTATAAILLWDTATWTVVSSGIKAHTLTVTQVAFSPDGKFLASASRDRSFAVSERVEDETEPFRLVSTVTKAHGRIIWGISWSPDASMVLTASRDGFLGVWRVSSNGTVQQPAATMIGFEKQSVCCVDTCELPGDEKTSGCLVAVGLESGMVVVGTVTSDDSDVHWREVWRSNEASKHTGAVRKVAWRPQRNNGASGSLYDNTTVLATCGDDHAVRLFHVCLH
jgi:elongator complex protein 2